MLLPSTRRSRCVVLEMKLSLITIWIDTLRFLHASMRALVMSARLCEYVAIRMTEPRSALSIDLRMCTIDRLIASRSPAGSLKRPPVSGV